MKDISGNNNYLLLIKNFFVNNFRNLIFILVIILIIFGSFQIYNFYNTQNLKKNSIIFFNLDETNEKFLSQLNQIKENENIFSILSTLKLIQYNNDNKNYEYSNELYKEIIFSSDLNDLYLSNVAAQASYTMIEASYIEKTNNYFEDISSYIDKINDNFDSYFSIKMELQYLLAVCEIDINKSEYKNNSEINDLYEQIINSNLISSSVKERLKKIHEFQIYK